MARDGRQHEFTGILGAPYAVQEDERGVLWFFEGDDGTRIDAMIGGRWLAPLAAETLRLADQVASLREANDTQAASIQAMAARLAQTTEDRSRLASPEAAWEKIEAFHRGVEILGRATFGNFTGMPEEVLVFKRDPVSFLRRSEPGLREKLLTECLRLGRESTP